MRLDPEAGCPCKAHGANADARRSRTFAARFPSKVSSLILAGSPIDIAAGDGSIKKTAHELPISFFEEMVAAGNGRMLGKLMLAGWKNMHPDEQYLEKYVDLYEHIGDRSYIKRTERFERWYENPIDETSRLEPAVNPFEAALPMSPAE